jgi:Zn-dependent oligopeptidase
VPDVQPYDAASLWNDLWSPLAMWQAWWQNFAPRLPLSGDVTQRIDPAFVRAMADQLGFININTSRAGDPQLERRITEQVASYGRQLGRVLDALEVVVRCCEPSDLSPADQQALDKLHELYEEINAVKEQAARERVDRLVADVEVLRRDPEANQDALQRIREALG